MSRQEKREEWMDRGGAGVVMVPGGGAGLLIRRSIRYYDTHQNNTMEPPRICEGGRNDHQPPPASLSRLCLKIPPAMQSTHTTLTSSNKIYSVHIFIYHGRL